MFIISCFSFVFEKKLLETVEIWSKIPTRKNIIITFLVRNLLLFKNKPKLEYLKASDIHSDNNKANGNEVKPICDSLSSKNVIRIGKRDKAQNGIIAPNLKQLIMQKMNRKYNKRKSSEIKLL